MKRIALIVVLASTLLYFLVSRIKEQAQRREDAILDSLPKNAFYGPGY
jgi:preprotein translocase subunit YajC